MTDTTGDVGENTQTADSTQELDAGVGGTTLLADTPDAADDQPSGDSQGEGQDDPGEEGKQDEPEGAPEKYEFTAPEGAQLDAAVVDAFSEVAKELNLPQDKAQKVIDKVAPMLAQRQSEAMQKTITDWHAATLADPEIGGDNLAETVGYAKKALNTFGSPTLVQMLDKSGLGNNPEFIRAFSKIGKAISEDSFVGGTRKDPTPEDGARSLYPNSNHK